MLLEKMMIIMGTTAIITIMDTMTITDTMGTMIIMDIMITTVVAVAVGTMEEVDVILGAEVVGIRAEEGETLAEVIAGEVEGVTNI